MGRHRFFCVLIALFFASAPLFASGTNDPILSRADQLVKEKKYNEAINLLTEFIRKDDVRFDPAQERIRKILKIFDEYDRLVTVLMNVVEEHPDDDDRIVSIANELRHLDAAHNEETRNFVNRIQEVARFTINRKIIEGILKQGRELIEKEDYIAALKKYREGFEIFEYDLRDANFRPEILNETRRALDAVDRAIATAESRPAAQAVSHTLSSLSNSTQGAALARNRQIISGVINSLSPELDALTGIKSELAAAHDFFERIGNLPEIDGSEKAGRLYYPAAALFLRGRSSNDLREGMLGAIDGIWRGAVNPLSVAFGNVAENLYKSALNSTEAAHYPAAREAISTARDYLKPLDTLTRKTDIYTGYDAGFTLPKNSERPRDSMTRFKSMDNALVQFDGATGIGTSFGALETRAKALNFNDVEKNATTPERFFNEFAAIQKELGTLFSEGAERLNTIARENSELRTASAGEDALRYNGDSRRVIEALGTKIAAGELEYADKIYSAANQRLKNELDTLAKQHSEGARLLSGVKIKTEQGADVEAKYSREAAEIFETAAVAAAQDIDIGERALSIYNTDSARPELADKLKPHNTETEDYLRRLRELRARDSGDLALAKERYMRAESLRIDGSRLVGESRRSLSAENFDLARERLETAAGRFVESLGLQENPALRRLWPSELEPLANEIARLEYEYIVKEVRGLIDTSRDRYYAGTFERAEESLVRAEGRWSKVNVEPNDEITYWLGLVRGALSLRSGANVAITAPLYPEVSQLLSDAKKNYNEGISLMQNRREAGMIKFAQAKEKTQEIKSMFPVNQEAGILELRIDKVIDPDAFETSFRRRFVTAIAGTKRGEREQYFELENLSKINPSYPGIEAALLEAKYDVGLLRRPVDNTAQNEAASYIAQARRIFSQGGRGQNTEVIRLAQAALRIDPNNREAARLLDQARLRDAADAAARTQIIAADPNAEQEYLLAVAEFQQGRALNALARIQRLLRHPAHQNNRRFTELLRRITAVVQ